jgi:hypothetical protein
MSYRISSQIKKVAFGNSFAFKIESRLLKALIAKGVLDNLLPFDDGYKKTQKQFPTEPVDGFIDVAFEWILRYTYVQHNYLLMCYTIPELFDCSDIPTAIVLGRKCTVMINKYTQDMFLVSFRFSDDMYKGTILDGILLKDNCTYPDYFESTYQSSQQLINGSIPDELQNEFEQKVAHHKQQLETEKREYTFNEKREIFFRDQPEWYLYYITGLPLDIISVFSQYYEPYRYQLDEEEQPEQPKEKVVETDLSVVWENFKEITQTVDFSEVFKQKALPPQFVFHVQGVYRIFGEYIAYSPKKLVNAISYTTLLKMQKTLFQLDEHWIQDEWIQPFTIKNSIDTMYYTRHTQVDLRNPYHNDYLRYHPKCHPKDDNNIDECEYKHFIPEMTPEGELWGDVYELGKQLVTCTLHRTKFPYVYSLTSNDDRVEDDDLAKVYTLECRRYIRVVLNKIHSDREKPVIFKCRPVIQKSNKEIIGWIPVKYDIRGSR